MVVIIFLSVPILLIIWELVLLVRECIDNPFEASMAVDGLVFFLGALYLCWFLSYAKWTTLCDWNEQIINSARHTPVYTGSILTVAVILLLLYRYVAVLSLQEPYSGRFMSGKNWR